MNSATSPKKAEGRPAEEFETASATPTDETDLALRAYIARLSDEKVLQYDARWDDRTTMLWCDDFRSDGNLMLVCCERDVGVGEFRKVLGEYIRFRGF